MAFHPDLYHVYTAYKIKQLSSKKGAVVVVIVWQLDIQLPMQSVPINIDVVSSNLDQGEVYNIM
jgi:hypothetical protein